MKGLAWVEVQAGTESGPLEGDVVEEWVVKEVQIGPESLSEVVIGAMAEALGEVVVGPFFGSLVYILVEALTAFLVEVEVGSLV